jgi:membrane associated rhomboid family serine protease
MKMGGEWWLGTEKETQAAASRRNDNAVDESMISVYIEDDDDDEEDDRGNQNSNRSNNHHHSHSSKDVRGQKSSLSSSDEGGYESKHETANSTSTSSSTNKDRRKVSNNNNNNNSRKSRSDSNSNNKRESSQKITIKELIALLDDSSENLPPALERRIRDFKFAQSKRRERHGEQKPFGIFGLYAHLSDIRSDLEWAEDAAWRRQNGHPYLSWTDFEKTRDNGLVNRPWFTYFVLGLCTIMMVVTFGVNDWSIEPLSVNPLVGPSSQTLIQVGARHSSSIVNDGQWYRLLTPMVLHAGVVHYVLNMLALYYVGAAIEQSHGMGVAAMIFIIPAVGGNILSAIFLPQYISVGASGGIFGLIGGCVADIIINWNLLFLKTTADDDDRWRHVMVLFWLALDIILNGFIGLTPFVDNFTHLGGFLYGLCCGLSTLERLAVGFFGLGDAKWSRLRNLLLRSSGLILSVVMILVTTILLNQSDGNTSPCHKCRYLSCVPFPFYAEDKWWYCDDCDFVAADLYESTDGSGLFQRIELTCPNGAMANIDITDIGFHDKNKVQRELPSYCRSNCDDVFSDVN